MKKLLAAMAAIALFTCLGITTAEAHHRQVARIVTSGHVVNTGVVIQQPQAIVQQVVAQPYAQMVIQPQAVVQVPTYGGIQQIQQVQAIQTPVIQQFTGGYGVQQFAVQPQFITQQRIVQPGYALGFNTGHFGVRQQFIGGGVGFQRSVFVGGRGGGVSVSRFRFR